MVAMCLSMYTRLHRIPLENLLYTYARQMGYSFGLLCTDTFLGIELNKFIIDLTIICFRPCNVSPFYKLLIRHDLVKLPETL